MRLEPNPNARYKSKEKRERAVYEFKGPDGKVHRKVTFLAHGKTAYAQFIEHPDRGWCFIGMESLVRYLAFEHMPRPNIKFIKAKRV